ncbi:MAG: hypothetical protein AB8H79_09785 [Myxococcota bacterium]
MVLVSGTFRSGTSMWMQILQAAGLPLIGSAYPAYWGDVLGDFNERGFHESRLRAGVWWKTNPHPETGAYLFPEQTRRHLVKVFAHGLTRTDAAFIDFAVITLRDWRSFTRSFDDLHTREKAWFAENNMVFPGSENPKPIPYQWWAQNYELIRDIATRRHSARFLTYDRTLRNPSMEIGAVLDALGIEDPAKRAAAIACVEPSLSSPRPPHPHEQAVHPDDAKTFDALFQTIDQGQAIGPELIERLNATQRRIVDQGVGPEPAHSSD